MNTHQLEQWIKNKQATNIQTSSRKADDNVSIVTVYQWIEDGVKKSAMLKDDHILYIDSFQTSSTQTLSNIVAGLGNPAMVYRHAEAHEQVLYEVELDYPNLGVSVGTSSLVPISNVIHGDGWAVQLKPSMNVDYVSCYPPQNSVELVLESDYLDSPISVQIQLERREAWSGFDSWLKLDNVP